MRTILFVGLAVSLGGCVPERDNNFDPLHAPKPQLVVADAGAAPGGECPAVLTSSLQPVGFVSRGKCIVLDARGSTDPDGDSLLYEYRLPPVDGTSDPVLVVTSSNTLALAGSYRRQLPLGSLIRFGVGVSDNSGRNFAGRAEATVVLANAAPAAVTDVSRHLPVGGFPWALGTPFDVAFDASASSDPDGDPLSYCWTFPDAGESCSPDPAPRRTVGTSRGVYAASLRVSDNADVPSDDPRAAFSRRVFTSVTVTEPVLWATYNRVAQEVDTLQRIDTLRPLTHPFVARDAALYPGTPATGGEALVVVADNPVSPTLRLVNLASGLAAADTVTLVNNATAVGVDPARNRVWTLSRGGGNSKLAAWSITSATTIDPDMSVPVITVSLSQEAGSEFIEVAENGTVWTGQDPLSVISVTGTVLATHDFPGRAIGHGAARPGTEELWVLLQPDIFDPAAPTGSALAIFSMTDGVLLEGPLELGNVAVSEFAWIDRDLAWVSRNAAGLSAVDMPLLRSGMEIDQATLVRVQDALQMSRLVVDRATGACWSTGDLYGTSQVFHTTLDADFSIHPAPWNGRQKPFFVDPDGALWWTDGGSPATTFFRSSSFDPSGAIASLDIAAGVGAVDSATGWLWLPIPSSSSLFQVTGDGFIRRVVNTAVIDDVVSSMPRLGRVRVEPGGEALWGIASDVLATTATIYRVDLRSDPPRATAAFSYSPASPSINPGVFEPGPRSSEFMWMLSRVPNPLFPHVAKLSTGGLVNVYDVPEPTQIGGLVRSPSTGNVCLVTREQTTEIVRVRWIEAGGSVSLITQFDLDLSVPNYNLEGVAVSADAIHGEICWVELRLDNSTCNTDGPIEIRGYRPGSAVPYRTATVVGRLSSGGGGGARFQALSGDELVLVRSRSSGAGCTTSVDERVRLSWNGSEFSQSVVQTPLPGGFHFSE